MGMASLARRLTIVTLIMTIFALSFAALASGHSRRELRVHLGTEAPCYHPATAGCVAVL
jgi:hypothetical protein